MVRAEASRRYEGWGLPRAYAMHMLLAAVIAGECLCAAVLHRGDDELREALRSGMPEQKVAALMVLTNRGLPPDLGPALTWRLLRSDDVLVREWTMTANFTRLAAPRAQWAYIESLGSSPEALRCAFLLYFRVGPGRSMSLSDLRMFLDAQAGSG